MLLEVILLHNIFFLLCLPLLICIVHFLHIQSINSDRSVLHVLMWTRHNTRQNCDYGYLFLVLRAMPTALLWTLKIGSQPLFGPQEPLLDLADLLTVGYLGSGFAGCPLPDRLVYSPSVLVTTTTTISCA